ncbi:MAG: DUF2232 domain-containing protein [Hyphomicrobiales bacterium]|nr:DUF2232 domain-containing protein [Hyphomicrobiales bacterium]
MTSPVFIGLICGVASALAYASLATQTPLAFGLFLFAPLGLFVAGLGWGGLLGLFAMSAGAALSGFLLGGSGAVGFALIVGLTPVVSCFAAERGAFAADDAPPATPLSPGALVAVSVSCAAVVAAALMELAGVSEPQFREQMSEFFKQENVRDMIGLAAASPELFEQTLDITVSLILPAMTGAILTILMLLNFWAAASILRRSGRLMRPWPDLAVMRYPNGLAIAAILATAFAFASGGQQMYAAAAAGALLAAYFIMGMIVVRALASALPFRTLALAIVWASLIFLTWPAFLLIAATGLADQFFNLRGVGDEPTSAS